MPLPKIHYDLAQIAVACGLYSNYIVLVQYNLQCKMLLCVNSNYFYFIINCGSKMVHYCTKSWNSLAKPSSFPARPLGMLYLCAASRLLV